MAVVAQNRCHLSREAQAAYTQGDYRRAQELFRTLRRQQRHEPSWRLELASILIAMVEFAAAERLLDEAIALSGGNSTVTRVVALAYFRVLALLRHGDPTGVREVRGPPATLRGTSENGCKVSGTFFS